MLGALFAAMLAGCGKAGQGHQSTASTQATTVPSGEATTTPQPSATTTRPSNAGSQPKNYAALKLRLAKAIGAKINEIGLYEAKLGEKEECGEVTGIPGNESVLLAECYYEVISNPNTPEPRREIWGYSVHLTNEESYTAYVNRQDGHDFAERSGGVYGFSGSLPG